MLKLVTVLFADVVGSTARAEKLHPEDVRSVMTDYFDAMAQEIRAEGGTVEKFVGDAVMAVFGVPSAHEDDPVRAVRAAWRMLDRLREWNAGRAAAERLEIRIGLEMGDVIASGEASGELLVTGDSVNVAARLQQRADPGTILVGSRTARAVRSRFALREVEEQLRLKGKSEPMTAWRVVGERQTTEERGVPGVSAPLVGREHELASLKAAFERIAGERRPELLTLLGDAGIGKSRLVREFVAQLETSAKVLVGRCLPTGQGTALLPLADMLKAEAVVFDSDTTEAALSKVAQLVETAVDRELAPEPSRTGAALASTLNLQQEDDMLRLFDPRARHREIVTAWRAFLASLARHDPVVAIVEDLHWADPTMLDILDDLAERLEGPIVFICTARSDLLAVRPDWGGGRRSFSTLPLDPLNADESVLLVSHLLDVASLPAAIRQGILERTEGNPFFLEEIVRHLIDEDLLVFDDGRWRARDQLATVDLPDSVQAVILARLDLLSPPERRVAQRAAVIGRFFWDGAIASIADVDDLDAVFRTLRRREFVVERVTSSIAGQREFVFKHVLIRDVAYDSLPRRERGRAHADTAAWLERTGSDRAADVVDQLAHHYEAAYRYLGSEELRLAARAHLLTASAHAHRRFAIEHGERVARRAVELSQAGAERVEALEALGDLHYHVGDAAWRAYADALAELSEDDPAFPRLAGKAAQFGARWLGTMAEPPSIDEVRTLIEAGLHTARPSSRERALLLVAEGFLRVQREHSVDDTADAVVDDAVSAAEACGDADVLSGALDLAEAREMYRGRYGEKRRDTRRRVELVPRLRDVREIGDTYAMAAWAAQHIGLYREAEANATMCVERSRDVDAGAYLHGLTWRVVARFMLGDWDGALVDQAELERVAVLDSRGIPVGYTRRAYSCAALCHELRSEKAADRYIDLCLRALAESEDTRYRGSFLGPMLARALARRNRFDEALAVVPFVPRTGNAGITLEALCEIAAARQEWDEASALVETAREETEAGELVTLPLFADRLEGQLAASLGDASRAAALLRRSADGFHEVGARWEEAFSRLLLAEIFMKNDTGVAQRELAAALPVFEQLHSVREAERTRALLEDVLV
jgi:class 3 adenylate cyclase